MSNVNLIQNTSIKQLNKQRGVQNCNHSHLTESKVLTNFKTVKRNVRRNSVTKYDAPLVPYICYRRRI